MKDWQLQILELTKKYENFKIYTDETLLLQLRFNRLDDRL